MIIAFYPGAGGNRYALALQQSMVFESNQTYDHLLKSQDFVYRYLESDTIGLKDQELILTHCLNVPLLKLHFPNQTDIVVIISDLESSLKREFYLEDQHRDKDMTDKVEHALAHISFHCRYYKQYPVNLTGASLVIDINKDNSDFTTMMRNEINNIVCEEYNQASKLYNKLQPQDRADLPGDKIVDGFKSKFLDDAEKMRLELDKFSPSLCLAKWKQVSLHLATGMNNSCYHPPLHKIPIEEIGRNPGALHNTPYKKEQRKMMLNGERPAECSYCWTMEDLGKLSDRHYRSGEPWAAMDFGKIVSSEWNDDFVPSYVEVNFNHACNLSCSYCSPQFSSTWQAEVERSGGYPTTTIHNDPSYFTGNNRPIPASHENPYVDAFWKWWPTLYPQLKHFRMTGGEPLMDKNTYKVFDYVLALPNPELHLNVTSNFSVEPQLWNKYFDYVKKLCDTNIEHFMQYVSLDSGVSEHAEYIRHGLNFHRLKSRVNHFLHDIPSRNSLTFIITMNNLSVLGLKKQLEWILELRKQHSKTYQRVWFDTPLLRQPTWQSLQIMPPAYAGILERTADWMELNLENPNDPFHGFKDYEVQRLRRDIAWMKDGQKLQQDYVNKNRADFYRFFNEHDARRGTDFLKTFPEMSDWWKECEYHARQT